MVRRVLDVLNDVYHLPVVGEHLVYGHWLLMALLAPIWAAAIVLYDYLSGQIFQVSEP